MKLLLARFEQKYALAMSEAEIGIRNSLDILWRIPNELFNIIRACAEANPAHPIDSEGQRAVEGAKFCRALVRIIDALKIGRDDLTLSNIKEGLDNILLLINKNKIDNEEAKQFPHVSSLIFEMVPHSRRYDRKLRDQYYQKARKGLSRINSITISILRELNKLLGNSYITGQRFEAGGANLSEGEIKKFIREYGDDYMIPDLETWSYVMEMDPALKDQVAKIIHALFRGQVPSEMSQVMLIIQNILNRKIKDNNEPYFENNAWINYLMAKYSK